MNHAGRNRSIFKTVFSVSSVLLIAKLLGFVKQIVVANAFGATADTDVISLSQGIITDFEFLIAQTMITAFIPIYISVKENNQDEKHFLPVETEPAHGVGRHHRQQKPHHDGDAAV